MGCQERDQEKAEDPKEPLGVSGEAAETSSEPEVAAFDYRKYLVAILAQDKQMVKRPHVGLGFRLNEQSEDVYVAYLQKGEGDYQYVFVDGERPSWAQVASSQYWKSSEEPLLRVARIRAKVAQEFPVLDQYADLEGEGSEKAFFAEEREIEVKPEDAEMQRIIDDEAEALKKDLRKYQAELSDLLRERSRENQRLISALQSRVRKFEEKLRRLGDRARRLGLIPTGRGGSNSLWAKAIFTENEVGSRTTGEAREGLSQGVVLDGSLALISDGKVSKRLLGKNWVKMVKGQFDGGRVWFRLNRGQWFPRVSLEWKGFAAEEALKSFVIYPYREGKVDRGAPIALEDDPRLDQFSLNLLGGHKEQRFRCQLELDPGSSGVVETWFDFEVRSEGTKVVPVALKSEDLAVQSEFQPRRSGLKLAENLKTLKVGGGIVQAVSYDGGAKLLIRAADPSKIRILDTHAMKWEEEWELPHGEVVTTSNGRDLFLFDPKNGVLSRRALAGFASQKEVSVKEGEVILAMGVGTEVDDGPLLLVYRKRLELRDPKSLKVVKLAAIHPSDIGEPSPRPVVVEFPNVKGSWLVHADPLGKAFSVSFSGEGNDAKEEKTISLFRYQNDWVQKDERFPVFTSRNMLMVTGRRYQKPLDRLRLGMPKSMSDASISTHAEGRGFVGVSGSVRNVVFPPPPMMITYLPSAGAKEIFMGMGAQAGASHFRFAGQSSSPVIGRIQSIFLLSGLNRVVSLGMDEVVFEKLPDEVIPEWTVVERTPYAVRGELYRYLPKARNGEVPDFKIVEGPDGVSYSMKDGFQWGVPPNFVEDSLPVKVIRVGSTAEEVFHIPVCGGMLSGFFDVSDPSQVVGVKPVSCGPFETPIYDVKPVEARDLLLVTFNESRSLRVVDLKTAETVSELDSPGGPMEVCPYEGGVLICYLDGMILEQRTLPGLERLTTKVSGASGRLTTLVIGHAKNSGTPFGLFDSGGPVYSAREFDLEGLTFGPEIPIAEFWSNDHGSQRKSGWLRKSAYSSDGRKVWFDGNLLKQDSPGRYTYVRALHSLFAAKNVMTDPNGQFVFSGGGRYQPGSRQPWTVSEGRSDYLIPGQSGKWMASLQLTRAWSGKPGKQSVSFIPAQKNEARYRLEGLPEWASTEVHDLQPKTQGNVRMLLCGSGRFLVTIPLSEREFLIRELPIPKD